MTALYLIGFTLGICGIIAAGPIAEWLRRNQIAPGALPSRYPTTSQGLIMKAMLENLFDKFRMAIWLALGLALYALSAIIGADHPQWQTVAYKLGHVTTLSWFGYWIARMALGRLSDDSHSNDRIARAIALAGALIAGSLGL